jgi:hypothetical protein
MQLPAPRGKARLPARTVRVRYRGLKQCYSHFQKAPSATKVSALVGGGIRSTRKEYRSAYDGWEQMGHDSAVQGPIPDRKAGLSAVRPSTRKRACNKKGAAPVSNRMQAPLGAKKGKAVILTFPPFVKAFLGGRALNVVPTVDRSRSPWAKRQKHFRALVSPFHPGPHGASALMGGDLETAAYPESCQDGGMLIFARRIGPVVTVRQSACNSRRTPRRECFCGFRRVEGIAP